jgi:hypothetical protein
LIEKAKMIVNGVKNPVETKRVYDTRFDPKPRADENVSSVNFRRNRYAMWDLYTGKPVGKYNPFEVSSLSTTKRPAFTIKRDVSDQGLLTKDLDRIARKIETGELSLYKSDRSGYKVIPAQSQDEPFGVMGNFNWKVKHVGSNKYHVIADDLWDLHPLQTRVDKYKKYIPIIKNMRIGSPEFGKTFGFGKPVDTKVQFDLQMRPDIKTYNSKTPYNLLRQYGLGGML